MNFLFFFVAVGAAYLAVTRWLLPAAEIAWQADSSMGRYSRAATIAGLTTARASLQVVLTGLIATAALVIVCRLLAEFGGLTVIGGLSGLTNWLLGIATATKSFSVWALMAVCGAALLWFAWRRRTREVRSALETEHERQMIELFDQLQKGTLPDLAPDATMSQIAELLGRVDKQRLALENAAVPDTEAVVRAQQAYDELISAYVRQDLSRRVDLTQVGLPDLESYSLWPRVGRFLFSEGMVETLGSTKKWSARLTTGLTVMSLIGVSSPALAGSALMPLLDSLTGLYVSKSAKDADRELAKFATQNKPQQSSQPASMPNAANPVYRRAAVEFVRAVARPELWSQAANSAVPAAMGESRRVAAQGADDLSDLMVREAIVREYASSRSGAKIVADGLGTTGDAGVDARFAATLDNADLDPAHAYAGLTDRIEQVLAEAGRKDSRFAATLKAQVERFNRPAKLWNFASASLDQAMGMALDAALAPPDALVARHGRAAVSDSLKKAVNEAVKIKFSAYLDALRSGHGLDAALAGVSRVSRNAPIIAGAQAREVDALLETIDGDHKVLLDGVHDRLPTLRYAVSNAEVERARMFVVDGDDANFVRRFSGGLGGYDGLFEANRHSLEQSALAKANPAMLAANDNVAGVIEDAAGSAGNFGNGGSGGGGGAREGGVRPGKVGRYSFARSSFRMSRSIRVGGVVIGELPKNDTAANFRSFAWDRAGSEFTLSLLRPDGTRLPIGRFAGAMIQQALAYAADERTVAATMTDPSPIDLRGFLRVNLHPALANTALGQDIIELDRFVDESASKCSIEKSDPICIWRQRVLLQLKGYDIAWQRAANPGEAGEDIPAHETELFMGAFPADWNRSDPKFSIFAYHPNYYTPEAVKVLQDCARGTVQAYWACSRDKWPLGANAAPPNTVWSGVREKPFGSAEDFLADPGMRFMLQVAYDASDDPAIVDDGLSAWEFPMLANSVDGNVRKIVASNSAKIRILHEVDTFSLLQRAFRLALDRRFGKNFDLASLLQLGRESRAADPVRSAPTPDWHRSRGEAAIVLAIDRLELGNIRSALQSAMEKQAANDPGTAECLGLLGKDDAIGSMVAVTANDNCLRKTDQTRQWWIKARSAQFLASLLADPQVTFAGS